MKHYSNLSCIVFIFIGVWIVAFLYTLAPDFQNSIIYKASSNDKSVNTRRQVRSHKDLTIPKINHDLIFKTSSPSTEVSLVTQTFNPPPPRPIHTIEYGIFRNRPKRTPFVMIRSKLGPQVYSRFLDSPLFSCPQSELESYHLHSAVDYPKSKATHTYYEGYFHSLKTSDPIFSRNPRSGKEFQKPAAGDFIRAFYEAFRRVNAQVFDRLRLDLNTSAISRHPRDPEEDICGILAKWIGDGLHFGDLSVQLHFGSAIRGDELFWHSDAENSLLHLGISIRGTRILHSKRASTESGDVFDILEQQNPGDVYLSSSTLVNHAPEYPAVLVQHWDDRIIAVQARLLYTSLALKAFRDRRTPASWEALTDVLSKVLASAKIAVPSMSQIDLVLEERVNE